MTQDRGRANVVTFGSAGCQGPLPVRTWTQHVTRSTQEQCRRRRTHRTFTRSQAQAMWPDDSLALASTGPRQASRRPTPGSPPPTSIAIVLPSLTLLYSTMQYGVLRRVLYQTTWRAFGSAWPAGPAAQPVAARLVHSATSELALGRRLLRSLLTREMTQCSPRQLQPSQRMAECDK